MAVSKKPKIKKANDKGIDVDALINKGGSPAMSEQSAESKYVQLRIPSDVLEEIDEVVNAKRIKTPRHTWLLEAVFEKLEREA